MQTSVGHIEKLIHEGHFAEARARAEGLLKDVGDIRLKQLYALSLSKSGSPLAAEEYLRPVYSQFPDDPETAGILGGIYKELFRKKQEPRYALQARDTYLKNFLATKNYYPGINAAAMAVMAGQASKGRETAKAVIEIIDADTTDFWELVTLAEAYLLTKNSPKAIELYLKARKMVTTDWGKINSVSNQLWLLNHYLTVPGAVIKAYQPPCVAAFVGHMIDRHDRPTPRFPFHIEEHIKNALVSAIRTLNIKIGYTSIACGSDILFCEALIEAGGELNIILAFDKEEFLETSVRFAGNGWEERFQHLIENHPVTYLTHEKYEGTDELFALQSRMILGSALHRASLLQTKPHLISVLSETDLSRKSGGTRDTIALWPDPTQQWTNINPDNYSSIPHHEKLPAYATKEFKRMPKREVRYLVHVVSDINEVSEFAEAFISNMPEQEGIASCVDEDSYVIALKSLRDANEFTAKLSDHLKTKNIYRDAHIMLHVGPIIINGDEKNSLQGDQLEVLKHVITLTLPGELYATSPFAMAASLPQGFFSFEYAGKVDYKKFSISQDLFRVYREG